MTAIESEDREVERAGWIVGRSRAATIAELVVSRSTASVDASRVAVAGRRALRQFLALSSGERARCALIMLAAALGGHVLMATLLPAAASPTVALTAVALLGAGVAAVRALIAPPR